MPYFNNPTIDFNMLQYISSSDSQLSEDLPAGLLVDFNDPTIPDRLRHATHKMARDI